MIEIVKFLAELLVKIVPQVSAQQRKNEHRRIGTDLLRIYSSLCDCLWLGNEIVDRLEDQLEGLRSRLQHNESATAHVDAKLRSLIEGQLKKISLAGHLLGAMSSELNLVDPRGNFRLRKLLSGKQDLLLLLVNGSVGGDMPLAFASQGLVEMLDLGGLSEPAKSGSFGHALKSSVVSLPNKERWGLAEYDLVLSIADIPKRRAELADIEEALIGLREKFVEVFSIDDMLPQARDQDMKNFVSQFEY